MGSKKRAHLDDYVLTDDGSYEYRGARWHWEHPEQQPGLMGFALGLDAVAGACLLAAGFVPAAATRGTFYVELPYVGAVVLWVLATASLVVLLRAGDELRDHVYRKHVLTLVPKLIGMLVCAAAGAVGTIMHALFAGQLTLVDGAFAALLFAAALCMGDLASRIKEVSFVKAS